MVRRASIAACLVALVATIGVMSAHGEPVAETTPAVVNGAHEAVAWIRVNRPTGSGEGDNERYDSARQKLIERLNSPLILVAMLRQPDIADLETVRKVEADPMTWLVAALDVTAPEKTDLIRVGVRGERVDDLQQIADAVAQTFVTDVVESDKTERLARRDQLEKKFKELQTDYRAKREARRGLEKADTAGKPADQAARRKRLDEMQREIDQLERIVDQIGLRLESTELDLHLPPKIQRVEAPTNTDMP